MSDGELERTMTTHAAWLEVISREYHGRALLHGEAAATAWRDEILTLRRLAGNGESPTVAGLSEDSVAAS